MGVDASRVFGAAVAPWQAVIRRRHPIRSFFMTLFITQLFSLIAVRNTKKTRHLVSQNASPHPYNENQKSDSEQKANGIRYDTVSCSYISHNRHDDDDEYHWQEPQKAK